MTYPSASTEHQLPCLLGGRQVPQSGPLPGIVCVVCVSSDLCCRLAGGQTGNYIHPDDQNGWGGLSTWHHWWYGWVIRLCSVTVFLFSFPLLHSICFSKLSREWFSFVHYKYPRRTPQVVNCDAPNYVNNDTSESEERKVQRGNLQEAFWNRNLYNKNILLCVFLLQVLPESLLFTVTKFTSSVLLTSWCVLSLFTVVLFIYLFLPLHAPIV